VLPKKNKNKNIGPDTVLGETSGMPPALANFFKACTLNTWDRSVHLVVSGCTDHSICGSHFMG
jgi:hypothetical protein